MDFFDSDGVRLAYEVTGNGPPVLLIHGFASNARVNWADTGWVRTLAAAGHQVITLDNRGHGESEKLYDTAAYGAPVMAADAAHLLSHLNIAEADVMGYSMGARIAAFLTITHPLRVRRAVFAGLAGNMIAGIAGAEEIANALEAPTIAECPEGQPRNFRIFAEQTRSDRAALAACMRSSRQKITPAELSAITCPVLVVAGEKDDIAGPVAPLLAAIPGAQGLTLAGRNHMNAVGDRTYKEAVINFLSAP
jgi:pimeloyl-ACP methyl ester carboxylesterase